MPLFSPSARPTTEARTLTRTCIFGALLRSTDIAVFGSNTQGVISKGKSACQTEERERETENREEEVKSESAKRAEPIVKFRVLRGNGMIEIEIWKYFCIYEPGLSLSIFFFPC